MGIWSVVVSIVMTPLFCIVIDNANVIVDIQDYVIVKMEHAILMFPQMMEAYLLWSYLL